MRELDDDVYDALRRRAAKAGLSPSCCGGRPPASQHADGRGMARQDVPPAVKIERSDVIAALDESEASGRMLVVDASCLYEVVADTQRADEVRARRKLTDPAGSTRNASWYTHGMTQIAVKLPDRLVRELDELVAQGLFPSRSSAVRRAVEIIVSGQRRHALEEAYANGYRLAPESESELVEAIRLAKQAIDDEPWEKWW
ncbi:MAG: ribbon-helix-helix domain-containing protein [Acidimicrobiia bacterium]